MASPRDQQAQSLINTGRALRDFGARTAVDTALHGAWHGTTRNVAPEFYDLVEGLDDRPPMQSVEMVGTLTGEVLPDAALALGSAGMGLSIGAGSRTATAATRILANVDDLRDDAGTRMKTSTATAWSTRSTSSSCSAPGAASAPSRRAILV